MGLGVDRGHHAELGGIHELAEVVELSLSRDLGVEVGLLVGVGVLDARCVGES